MQLVFAPHFKQRHIPRYKNDNNRKTHVESTRAMTRERGARAESKNCKILLFPTADRCFDTKVKCPTGWASFWVKFPTVLNLTRAKCPGIALGGMGSFGIDWYVNGLLCHEYIFIAQGTVDRALLGVSKVMGSNPLKPYTCYTLCMSLTPAC